MSERVCVDVKIVTPQYHISNIPMHIDVYIYVADFQEQVPKLQGAVRTIALQRVPPTGPLLSQLLTFMYNLHNRQNPNPKPL